MLRMAVLLLSLATLAPTPASASPSWHLWRSTLWTLGGEVWLDRFFSAIGNADGLTAADRYDLWRVDHRQRPIEFLFAVSPVESIPSRVSVGTFHPGRRIWLGLLDTQTGIFRPAQADGAHYEEWTTPPPAVPPYQKRMVHIGYTLNGAILQPASVIPEPAELVLTATGLLGLAIVRRRRREG